MKKITSLTWHATAEGDRLSFTYSEISDDGSLIRNNVRENYILLESDTDQLSAINTLKEYAKAKLG